MAYNVSHKIKDNMCRFCDLSLDEFDRHNGDGWYIEQTGDVYFLVTEDVVIKTPIEYCPWCGIRLE